MYIGGHLLIISDQEDEMYLENFSNGKLNARCWL